MDFNLLQEHELLSNSLRRYLDAHYTIEDRNKCAYEAPFQSAPVWGDLAEMGIVGAFAGEANGGFGGTSEDARVIFEEAGRALCAEPLLGTLMGTAILDRLNRPDLMAGIIAGDARIALAVMEPGMSLDLGGMKARAVQNGAQWRLNGRKSAIYGGPEADFIIIACRTDEGIGLFLSEKPSLISSSMLDGGGTADLVMQDMEAVCLVEDGETILVDILDLGRIALCSEAVGAMDALIGMTIEYLKQRQQFGKPIASFQALQHRVVDMLAELEQARSITIRASASFGTPHQARHTAMAKNLIGRAGTFIAEEAIQLHGGIGMTWEYQGSHYAKRLIMLDHQLGDRYDHAQRIVQLSS